MNNYSIEIIIVVIILFLRLFFIVNLKLLDVIISIISVISLLLCLKIVNKLEISLMGIALWEIIIIFWMICCYTYIFIVRKKYRSKDKKFL